MFDDESTTPIHASELVHAACEELCYRLSDLIALTSLWANPQVLELLAPVGGVWHPDRRRANEGLRIDGRQIEKVGDLVDGVTLDNNT